ncbi:MAG TPA: TIGR02453 family protein, partial [Bacteroidetes bacterium]|nr:TIGR02453 family protein [Bacteroidota bacterium]
KDAMFRLHRDVRFSKDKSPYKTHVSAHISRGGRKDMAEPGLYIEIGADKGGLAGGVYMPDKEQLSTIRSWIAEHPKEFRSAVTSKAFVQAFGEIRGDRNKIVPAEFRDAAQQEPLISLKQFYYWKDLTPAFLASKDLAKKIVDLHNAAKPVRDVLRAALHAS